MLNPMTSIIRQAKRQPSESLNILTCPTHERYESGLCLTGHNFYACQAQGIKTWNTNYAPLPDNYTLLNPELGKQQIPTYIEFDLVLSQNKFGQFQMLYPLAKEMNIPLISLEHTLPVPSWPEQQRAQLREMRGHINVFISEYSLDQWQWDDRNDTTVIHHMVDTDVFNPGEQFMSIPPYNFREEHILSVVNDWINRDWCCNFQGWQRITQGLPVKVLGDTPGLSLPAGQNELVDVYRNSRIFLNTSTISPVPTSLLEAMACGCAVVSTATCMIPEIIEDGVNGFISNDENILREKCKLLLNDNELAKKLGYEASKTIKEKFNKDRFVNQWNQVFRSVL
jgi:hypothetical protein